MYLGSAAAMLVLPGCAELWGAPSLLKIVGGLGFAWLALWLVVGREIPHRWGVFGPVSSCVPLLLPLHHNAKGWCRTRQQ